MSRQDANAAFAHTSFLYGGNADYIEDLYARYENDPKAVDAQWQAFFQSLKDDRTDVLKSAEGPSWSRPHWPQPARGELISALDGDWHEVEKAVGNKLKARAQGAGVEFSSAGTISEKYDDPMDRRAVAVLKERGYRYADHKARRIAEAQIESADLVVAMEDVHLRSVLELAPDPSRVCLLTEFDPTAAPGSGVPDPWFGSDADFYDTLTAIEAAMPGLLDRIRELQNSA